MRSNPQFYYNHETFRIQQAKAYHRAIPLALTLPFIAVYALKGSATNLFLRNNKLLMFGLVVPATYLGFFEFFLYQKGFDQLNWDSHNLAKYEIMLRSVKVKN